MIVRLSNVYHYPFVTMNAAVPNRAPIGSVTKNSKKFPAHRDSQRL